MLQLVALLALFAPDCRELRDGPPRFSPKGDTGYENFKVAVLECAGQRSLVFSKRDSATSPWNEVQRVQVTAPVANQTWFFDGATCQMKGATGDAMYHNRAVLAHAKAATGELSEWKPSEAWHVDLPKNKWVKDDVKKLNCHGDEP